MNAWIQSPTPNLVLTQRAERPWTGQLEIERRDLLSETLRVTQLPVRVEAGDELRLQIPPDPSHPYGVFKLQVTLQGEDGISHPLSNLHTYAYAPAPLAKTLDDDWPLGIHITSQDPRALPGFKWYRTFSMWAYDNPADGEYRWDKLDKAFGAVKEIGGRLVLANDSTPAWTVAPERVDGLPWVPNATAYPPDDLVHLRRYLDALFARYGDASDTLAVLEVWNEPNTPVRWLGTHAQMVEVARVYKQAAQAQPHPPRVFGVQLSAGSHFRYLEGLMQAGLLEVVDGVSGHWYEELMCFDPQTPISNLHQKVENFRKVIPAGDWGKIPVWNSESGISICAREEGKLVSQQTLNHRAEANPVFDPAQPWLLGPGWRPVSERRAAAGYVGGTLLLMSEGVEKTIAYTLHEYIIDDAPSLPWVAFGVLGSLMKEVDYRQVQRLDAVLLPEDAGTHQAVAIRLGAAEGPGLICVWAYERDKKTGRSKHWQDWQMPLEIRVPVHGEEVELRDFYNRRSDPLRSKDGWVQISAGEEPVYIIEKP